MKTNAVLVALAALAQETRLAVYRLLVEHAPAGLPAGQVAEKRGRGNARASGATHRHKGPAARDVFRPLRVLQTVTPIDGRRDMEHPIY